MPILIRELPHLLTPINGVAFAVHEAGSISDEMDDDLAELFLAVPSFRLATDADLPEPKVPTETAAQKKTREKAEAAAALTLKKAEEQKAAEELAEKKLADEKAEAERAEQEAKDKAATDEAAATETEKNGSGDKPEGDEQADNVF